VATYTSPYSFTSQRNDLGRAARWRATIEMPPLAADDAALLSTWLDQISRGEHVGLVPVHQNAISGTEGATAAFANLQQPWASGGLSGITGTGILVDVRVVDGLVIVLSSNMPPGFLTKSFTVVPNAYYEITIDAPPQEAYVRVQAFDGTATPLIANPGDRIYGRRTYVVSPTTNSLFVTIHAGRDSDSFTESFYGDLKVVRLMTVQTAQPAGGNAVRAWGGLNGALDNFKVGQFVQLQTSRGFEMKRVLRSSRQIGGVFNNGVLVNHFGILSFEPALRGSVAVNAPIIHIDPVCRMRLATSESTAVVDAPNFSGFTFDMVEDIAP